MNPTVAFALFIQIIFDLVSFAIIVRVLISILSMGVNLSRFHGFVRIVHDVTDPILRLFQKILPPIGGVLDLSPMIAIFALDILKNIILHFLLGA